MYDDYITDKVLTMEYCPSTKISDVDKIKELGLDRAKIAERLALRFRVQGSGFTLKDQSSPQSDYFSPQSDFSDFWGFVYRSAISYLEQLSNHGFFHCDPHPGNIGVDSGAPGGRLVYYDFGMMDEISGKPRKSVLRLACHDWGIMDEISCKP